MKSINILFLILFLVSCGTERKKETIKNEAVLSGADVLISSKLNLIRNKNVAIVTNPTGILKNGTHLIDTLFSLGIKIKALFGPEHGLRGVASAGKKINDGVDDKTSAPIYSLYGKHRQPTSEMLSDVDVIIFDMQDVGARFYTYISTMYYILKAAGENNKDVLILDRPDPIGGLRVEGPILDEKYKSFVGIAPLPIIHGMTIGELAEFFIGEKLVTISNEKVEVIKCENWKRAMYFDETGLPWVSPSPNIPNIETALIYPGICLLEATNVSEGRGTDKPFLNIGAPFIDAAEFTKSLVLSEVEGLDIKPVSFTPVSIKGKSENPKYKDQTCYGAEFIIRDRNSFSPLYLSINVLYELRRQYPNDFIINRKRMAKLYGNDNLFKLLNEGKTPDQIIAAWESELLKFNSKRKKYLLYD